MKARISVSTLLLSAAVAQAGTWYVKADATGNGSGTSWANATTSLSAMLAVVQEDSGHEIWVAAGTYRPSTAGLADPRRATFEIPHKTKLYGGFGGTETARDQRNPKVNFTILSGDLWANDAAGGEWNDPSHGENARHVVTLVNCDSSTILDGFTITGGYDERTHWHKCSGPAGDCGYLHADGQGAGILITGGGPKINDCIFQDNNVRGYGGGLYASASTALISNCTFYDNTAWTDTNGGGGGVALSQCVSTLTNCVILRNDTAHSGGAVNAKGSTTTLLNCTAFGNTGGAVFVGGGTMAITNCIVYGNPSLNPRYYTLTESQIRYSIYLDPPTVTYSCVEGGWSAAGGAGNIDTDPLFVNTATGDLHLQVGSPCIDTGNSAAPDLPDTDRDGKARVTGSAVDMGAYEYVDEPPPTDDGDDDGDDDVGSDHDGADSGDGTTGGGFFGLPFCGAGMVPSILACFGGLLALRRRT